MDLAQLDRSAMRIVPSYRSRIARWTLPAAALLAFAGYVGPWVPHPAAGLVVTGLDLAEYVKFLHPVRTGAIPVWRQIFYLPLVALSVTMSLYAYRRELAYAWPLKVGLLLLGGVAGLNLLPPAWSPSLLLAPDFRIQTAALAACLGLAAVSPVLALLPRWFAAGIALVLIGSALILPAWAFLRVLPAIADLYRQPLAPGWGLWLMQVGLLGLAAAVVAAVRPLHRFKASK